MAGRFGLDLAPGGLRLAQSLINTSLSGKQNDPEHDLLTRTAAANDWAHQALAEWSAATGQPAPRISLRAADLEPLRAVREQLRQLLRAKAAHVERPAESAFEPREVGIRLSLSADGRLGYAADVPGLVVMELVLARAAGSLSRLKTCAAHACGACFYDGSPNRTRAWHDTKMCGNGPNLRASRAHRKERG